MTTKELLKSEIDNLDDRHLAEIYRIVQVYAQAQSAPDKPSLMSRLRRIQFDAPEDFSTHLNHYTNGEKPIE